MENNFEIGCPKHPKNSLKLKQLWIDDSSSIRLWLFQIQNISGMAIIIHLNFTTTIVNSNGISLGQNLEHNRDMTREKHPETLRVFLRLVSALCPLPPKKWGKGNRIWFFSHCFFNEMKWFLFANTVWVFWWFYNYFNCSNF